MCIVSRLISILLLLLCCSAIAGTKIYKIIKPDGTVLYTDKPVPGAVPVAIGDAQNVAPALAPVKRHIKARSTTEPKDTSPAPDIRILSPRHEETVRNNAGEVTVKGDINRQTPGLFRLYLNGEAVTESEFPEFQLTSVPRGAHTIQLAFFDNKGKQLASSQQVTFYLHKASVNNR